MLSRLGGVLLVAVSAGVGGAQEAPAVDLHDPVAVVQAYARACGEGDVKAALDLLAPDDPSRPRLLELQGEPRRGGPRDLPAVVREYALVPMGLAVEQEVVGSSQDGDRAEVKVSAISRAEQTFVLARQPDGTWRVRLTDTLRASAPEGNSVLANAFEQPSASRPDGGAETWRSERNLQQLYQALQGYANDHGGVLPPADRWMDEIERYVLERAILKCPVPGRECCYAMNENLAGKPLPDDWTVREALVLLFESAGQERNAHASVRDASQVSSPRPDGVLVLVTAGGQTRSLQPGQKLGGERHAEESMQRCSENLRALVEAARKYAMDHEGLLPGAQSWEADIGPYVLTLTRRSGPPEQRWRSQSRLQALYKALTEYAAEHEDRLPPADGWVDELEPYVLDAETFKSPAAPDLEYGYAMNEDLSGQALPKDWGARRQTLVLFEWASGERNAHAPQDAVLSAQPLQPDGVRVTVTGDGNGLFLPPEVSVEDLVECERLEATCVRNLATLAGAARKYARDNDGVLPGAESWVDDLAPYLIDSPDPNGLFVCPAVPELEHAYAINAEVAGHNLAEFRGRRNVVLFFESDRNEPNAAGPVVLDGPGRRRHMDYWNAAEGRFDNVAYVSGESGRGPMQPFGGPADGGASALARALLCPEAPGVQHAYAINVAIAGKNATELTDHEQAVLFFESHLNVPNAAGRPEMDGIGRHRGGWGDQGTYTQVGYLGGGTGRLPYAPALGSAVPN